MPTPSGKGKEKPAKTSINGARMERASRDLFGGQSSRGLRLLPLALGLQHAGEGVDAVQGAGMPVSQRGAAWGTLQPGEDLRLQEAFEESGR